MGILHVNPGPQKLAALGISQKVIDRLEGFDLTGLVSDSGHVLGGGTYADVVSGELARPSLPVARVAIKRMRFVFVPDIMELFEKEIYVWAKFDHKNVSRFLGYAFEAQGFPLLVTELMENGSAREFAEKHKEFDVHPLIVGIAKGLKYLHVDMNAIHSDLKGINVLVSGSDPPRAVICDFGMTRIIEASLSLGRPTTTMKGTICWMAYELLIQAEQGPIDYTAAMDVWSFGMTVYELYSRKRPYHQFSVWPVDNVSSQIKRGGLPEFDAGEGNPRKDLFQQVCSRCWDLNPDTRIDIVEALELLDADV